MAPQGDESGDFYITALRGSPLSPLTHCHHAPSKGVFSGDGGDMSHSGVGPQRDVRTWTTPLPSGDGNRGSIKDGVASVADALNHRTQRTKAG